MEQISKQDYDFEPIALREFKTLITIMETNGATHMEIGYYEGGNPYIIFGKNDPEDLLKAFKKAEKTCKKGRKSLNIAYDLVKGLAENLENKENGK